MSKIVKKMKIMQPGGTLSDYVPIGADAENIKTEDGMSVENKLKKKSYYFDTVADMKTATYLVAGDMVVTLGYYSVNDGGGAEYKIVSTTSQTDYQEELNNELYATLVINDTINIKQIGIKENQDETVKFNKICGIKSMKIIIPNGIYKVRYFILRDSIQLIGIGKPTINIDIDNNNGTMSSIGSNNIIKNIVFKSLSDNKYGSRIDIYNRNNIIIEDCEFEHFLYLTNNFAMPILIRNSSNISVKNCKFSNNSQDFAISHGDCSNIYISNCIFNTVLNFEIETGTLRNCYIENSKINKLFLYGYSTSIYDIDDTIISNNIINEIQFKGSKFKLINNTIKDFGARLWLTQNASVIENVNSIYFKEQLNNDPNFYCFSEKTNSGLYNVTRDNYEEGYIPGGIIGKIENGVRFISLNEAMTSRIQSIQKTFELEAEEKYIIRTKMKVVNGDEGTFPSGNNMLYLSFYDEENNQIGEKIEINLVKFATPNATSEFNEKWIPFVTPENGKYLRVEFFNTRNNVNGISNSLWNTFKINKISSINLFNEEEDNKSKLSSAPFSNAVPKMKNVRQVGDIIYNSNLGTNNIEKWICTESTQSSPYTATYKYVNLS